MSKRAEVEEQLMLRASDDDAFRALLLQDPRRAMSEAVGVSIPDGVTFTVHEEDSTNLHMVLPRSDRLSMSELVGVAGGEGGGQDPPPPPIDAFTFDNTTLAKQ